jgi:hypothetical protein
MLGSGSNIPWITAQRFQQHVASVCALPWGKPIHGIVHLVLPSLRTVLDSTARLPIGPTAETGKEKTTILVGSLFVPIAIDFGNELANHDFHTQRCLLDILMILFYKVSQIMVRCSCLSKISNPSGLQL